MIGVALNSHSECVTYKNEHDGCAAAAIRQQEQSERSRCIRSSRDEVMGHMACWMQINSKHVRLAGTVRSRSLLVYSKIEKLRDRQNREACPNGLSCQASLWLGGSHRLPLRTALSPPPPGVVSTRQTDLDRRQKKSVSP